MNNAKYKLTASKVDELKVKLIKLEHEGRKFLADNLDTTRDDFRDEDDSELAELLNEKSYLEDEIAEIKAILANYELIEENSKINCVELGATVKLSNNGKKFTYMIVSELEADPLNGKISDVSPIGSAIMGKSVGDTIEMLHEDTPKKLKILEITR